MMSATERLEVALVVRPALRPRHDVINISGMFPTEHAPRIGYEVPSPDALPLCPVATLRTSRPSPVIGLLAPLGMDSTTAV